LKEWERRAALCRFLPELRFDEHFGGKPMTKLKLVGAAAVLSTLLATPLMAQEVTQEPGMTGFNYPNSRYLTGGYGQRTPWNTDRYPRLPYGGYVAVEPAPVGVAVGVGRVGIGVGAGPYGPYGAYAYDPY
jgi:hypothetical protein